MTTSTPTNVPIVNLPILYVNNLQVSRTGNTTLSMAAGQCRDSTDTVDITLTTATTNTASVNGVNGLDTGTFTASKLYYLHVINDSSNNNQPATLLSLSATSPTLPYGYDSFRMIAPWFTDGSTHYLLGYAIGNGTARRHFHDTSISVLSGGTSTSLAPIDLTSAVPVIDNTVVSITANYTPATANDTVSFAPYGSTATVLPHLAGSVAAKVNSGQFQILSKLDASTPQKPTILYINSAGSGATSVWVDGFFYNL